MTFGVEDMDRLPVQNYRILRKEIEYIQKLQGVRFYKVFVSVVEYDGYFKKNLYFRLHGARYPDCLYFLSSLLPLALSYEIR